MVQSLTATTPARPPSPRKEPVASILLKPKGFENVPLSLKKWVLKDQLDRGCGPGPEPAGGAQRVIPGRHISLRLRCTAAFAHGRWRPGQGQASVQGGGSRPCSVTGQFLPSLFPFGEYCCYMNQHMMHEKESFDTFLSAQKMVSHVEAPYAESVLQDVAAMSR